jgi:predicted RNase H-like HicB family nuclease
MRFDDLAGGKYCVLVNYTVILEKESVGGYHAFCPALRGCHSEGETEAEALQNIREAMEVYLESLAAHNEPISREEIVIHSIPIAYSWQGLNGTRRLIS